MKTRHVTLTQLHPFPCSPNSFSQPSMEHGEEDDSGLTEVNVQLSDGYSYEVPWTVYTALALPSGKWSTNKFASW